MWRSLGGEGVLCKMGTPELGLIVCINNFLEIVTTVLSGFLRRKGGKGETPVPGLGHFGPIIEEMK